MTDEIHTADASSLRYAGFFRRLLAIFYDSILLIAIMFTLSLIATGLNHGNAIEPGHVLYPLFVTLLFSLNYVYFAWFWMHGGQTLGMKTWYIKLQSNNDESINWKTAAIRFFSALISWLVFGLGFLWAFIDKKNRCWHDLSSKTVLIDLRPKK